jgi:hypothetical protein
MHIMTHPINRGYRETPYESSIVQNSKRICLSFGLYFDHNALRDSLTRASFSKHCPSIPKHIQTIQEVSGNLCQRMFQPTVNNEEQPVPETPKKEDDEPMNPALTEPDAIAIVRRAETSAPSVSLGRKKDLLVQARKDRRKWIQTMPLPYAQPRDPTNIWSLDDRLNAVQTSLAFKRLTTATKILSELYGLETDLRSSEDVAERVDALVSRLMNYRFFMFCSITYFGIAFILRFDHLTLMKDYSMVPLKF